MDQVVQEKLLEKVIFTWRAEWQKGPRHTKIREMQQKQSKQLIEGPKFGEIGIVEGQRTGGGVLKGDLF